MGTEEGPGRVGDYRYDAQDPRLIASHQLLLATPDLVFSNPQMAAVAFGIKLSDHFMMVQPSPFLENMSLLDHMQQSRVRYVSPLLLEFLGHAAEQIRTPLDVGWDCTDDMMKCDRVIRDSMTAKLPVYGIRQWEHTKKITVPGCRRTRTRPTSSRIRSSPFSTFPWCRPCPSTRRKRCRCKTNCQNEVGRRSAAA